MMVSVVRFRHREVKQNNREDLKRKKNRASTKRNYESYPGSSFGGFFFLCLLSLEHFFVLAVTSITTVFVMVFVR